MIVADQTEINGRPIIRIDQVSLSDLPYVDFYDNSINAKTIIDEDYISCAIENIESEIYRLIKNKRLKHDNVCYKGNVNPSIAFYAGYYFGEKSASPVSLLRQRHNSEYELYIDNQIELIKKFNVDTLSFMYFHDIKIGSNFSYSGVVYKNVNIIFDIYSQMDIAAAIYCGWSSLKTTIITSSRRDRCEFVTKRYELIKLFNGLLDSCAIFGETIHLFMDMDTDVAFMLGYNYAITQNKYRPPIVLYTYNNDGRFIETASLY